MPRCRLRSFVKGVCNAWHEWCQSGFLLTARTVVTELIIEKSTAKKSGRHPYRPLIPHPCRSLLQSCGDQFHSIPRTGWKSKERAVATKSAAARNEGLVGVDHKSLYDADAGGEKMVFVYNSLNSSGPHAFPSASICAAHAVTAFRQARNSLNACFDVSATSLSACRRD